ncbi:MAG: DUF4112 domain-containing protein [Thermoanaerobaculia bacterium]
MAPQKAFIPEVIEPDEKLPPDLVALRRFARVMDEAVGIPGTRFRFGADAALGLIPGVGDVVGGILSTWVVFGALRHRVPTRVILRMIVNVLIDVGIGEIPIVGDIFDFLFEENVMNMQLLLRHRDRTRPPRRFHEIAAAATLTVIVVIAGALMITAALIALVLYLISQR